MSVNTFSKGTWIDLKWIQVGMILARVNDPLIKTLVLTVKINNKKQLLTPLNSKPNISNFQ